jgi:hypothetical protein
MQRAPAHGASCADQQRGAPCCGSAVAPRVARYRKLLGEERAKLDSLNQDTTGMRFRRDLAPNPAAGFAEDGELPASPGVPCDGRLGNQGSRRRISLRAIRKPRLTTQRAAMTETSRDFEFDGRKISVRAVASNDGWRVRVFEVTEQSRKLSIQ